MLNSILDIVNSLLPGKRKTNSLSGWTSFNAVCCHHRGESQDSRGRGGIITNPNGAISYSCFNCNYTANYTPGRHLNYKFRKLLGWLGADENTVKRLVIDAIRIKELVEPEAVETVKEDIVFKPRPLPEQAQTLQALHTFYELSNNNTHVPREFHDAVIYSASRKIDLVQYDCYWTPEQAYNLHKRLIIPFTWRNEVIGYTARAIYDDVSPKYYSQYDTDYVYNVDRQRPTSRFVIVVEGPLDAMVIDGVAILGNECSEVQADIIDSLAREVIVVPDRDRAGIRLIDAALEYGWHVSFPVWQETCKDVSEAVERYGKLFVLKSIIDATETGRLKIELKKKRLHADSR
jgi:hypothetical protein